MSPKQVRAADGRPRAGWWRYAGAAAAACLLALGLAACGGGGGDAGQLQASATPAPADASSIQSAAKPKTTSAPQPSAVSSAAIAAPAGSDPGMLLLLVPDGTPSTDVRISAWKDAALETGVRITPVSDSDFMAMGSAAYQYGGLVLPDDIHTVASDEVIAAVRSYVNGGGRAMLTYDFGALYRSSTGDVFYAPVKSRLSDLAGVDYVLYDELRDNTIGIGPVTAMRSTMRLLQVPPGKSMAYTAPTVSTASTAQLQAAGTTDTQSARYLPASPQDPGGVHSFDFQQYSDVRLPTVQERQKHSKRPAGKVDWGKSRQGPKTNGVTKQQPASSGGSQGGTKKAGTSQTTTATTATIAATAETDVLDAYSGYYYGYLSYPSYVTRGTFPGTVLATSPDHGLVAGVNTYGSGQVLFVNLPLGYLKGRTDALPMHGFLTYFVRQVNPVAFLSPMPNGIAGMVFNWHLDSKEAQAPTLALEQRGVFKSEHLFSIHITAGPDTVTFGDGLGWDLNNNPTAKSMLQRFVKSGHDVGSHGGWIHDYYGLYASETNESEFLQYLVLNRDSVQAAVNRASRSYAAPEGNNPLWAMNWLEQQGVVAAYFLGHTGLGVTRQYRDGVLKNPNLYVVPLTPFGLYATFEEFQDNNLPQQDVMDWYHALVDFSIANNTNRMIYAHPPGANDWPNVLDDLLAYTKAKGTGTFRWYTMPQLADHLVRRAQVTWSETVNSANASVITASHPSSLSGMAWRLPKSAYQKPVVTAGSAAVSDKGDAWQVRPTGTSVTFQATRM